MSNHEDEMFLMTTKYLQSLMTSASVALNLLTEFFWVGFVLKFLKS